MTNLKTRAISRRPFLSLGAAALTLPLLAGAALAEPVKLKFATAVPPTSPIATQVFQPWIDLANSRSEGEFEIEHVTGYTMANPANVWERTTSGVVDIGWGLHGVVGLPFPKTTVTTLPTLSDDVMESSRALWALYKSGMLDDEYQGVRILALTALPVLGISSKEPINSLDDVKGLKIRAVDKVAADTVTALGGSPISVASNEVYQALSRGVVDAATVNWLMVGAFNVGEVAGQHQTAVSLGLTPGFVVMNPAAYDRLSPRGKEIFDKVVDETLVEMLAKADDDLANAILENVKNDPNQAILTLSDEEKARWEAALQPVIDAWVERTPDGAAVLAAYKAELEKLRK